MLRAARDFDADILILKHYDLWIEAATDPIPLLGQLRDQRHDARTLGLGERIDRLGRL
ncbi:MAG: hypothetical protein ACUVX9_04785 [Anaerolineae bacterium]